MSSQREINDSCPKDFQLMTSNISNCALFSLGQKWKKPKLNVTQFSIHRYFCKFTSQNYTKIILEKRLGETTGEWRTVWSRIFIHYHQCIYLENALLTTCSLTNPYYNHLQPKLVVLCQGAFFYHPLFIQAKGYHQNPPKPPQPLKPTKPCTPSLRFWRSHWRSHWCGNVTVLRWWLIVMAKKGEKKDDGLFWVLNWS